MISLKIRFDTSIALSAKLFNKSRAEGDADGIR